jgi:hypothetical protein
MLRPAFAPLLLILAAVPAAAQSLAGSAPAQAAPTTAGHTEARPHVTAVQRQGPILLDGVLDEPAWQQAQPASGFTQQDPDEGKPATQRTEVRIAYDEQALYVGARMFDTEGAPGVHTQLTRRDETSAGDYLMLVFDTFHDHAGRTIFQVNPSGVKYDAGQASPSTDPSWDPVWQVATRIDSLGWTAEMRIPLSQLRFPRTPDQTWGMQVWRYTERLNENTMWAFWGKQEPGGPPRFGHVEGLHLASHSRSMELLPYALTRASYVAPSQAGSPFEKPRAYDARIGGDLKALLGSNLTLDATVNPDFGQVEVDPAVVNLSAFETFFPEKRPFFVEGSGLLGFGSFSCHFCSNVSSMSLFYSRRIGRHPQGSLPDDADYGRVPESTTILGAAKLTGRMAHGWQVGVLDAVTRPEQGDWVLDGQRFDREVEPLTNYFVGRVKRTMNAGNLTLGAIATSVGRRITDDSLRDLLTSHAEAAGFDWNLQWKKQTYSFMGNMALSQVSGDTAAILRLQQAPARYFQRPGRDGGGNGLFTGHYDPSLTAMRGYGGYARLAKDAGPWQWESMVNYRSPGFEVNDMAFLTRADYVWMNANLLRGWSKPTRWYRNAAAIIGAQQEHNYSGDLTDRQVHVYGEVQFPNLWFVNAFAIVRPEAYDDRLLRGGAIVRKPGIRAYDVGFNTDSRKPVVFSSNPEVGTTTEGKRFWSANLDMTVKPSARVQVSLSPSFHYEEGGNEYVASFDDASDVEFFGRRSVIGDLVQRTLSLDTRLAVTFTPNLTLQLYAQPFVATGDYSNFKEYVRPRTLEKRSFDAAQLGVTRDEHGRDTEYLLDPDRNPATANFTFDNPDFNFHSLRGNAVVRWEYRPGSTLFFVWQQQRSGDEPFGDFRIRRDSDAVFRSRPDNVFVIKASWWLSR